MPAAVADALARIATPAEVATDPPDGVTGELARLWEWWATRAGEAPLQVAEVTPANESSAEASLVSGIASADRAIDAGATLLVPRADPRHDPAARAIIGLLTKREASALVDQPEGMGDQVWMSDVTTIRDLMSVHREKTGDHLSLLDGLDTSAIAGISGVLIGAAARSTPCLIDGTDEWAGALVADRIAHRARHWWRGAATSTDPARTAARERVDIAAGLPLDLSDDLGRGAQASVALLGLALGG